jgi:excisionase family DNA binding protein
MSPEKEYLSLEDVAETLGVTYQLIYRLVRSGELPAARLGKLYRVSKRDLNAYLDRSKQPAAGGVCAACGRTYESRLSLTDACLECGAAICKDCWTRRGERHCRAHRAAGQKG